LCLAVAWARADDPADPAASSPASAGDRWPVPATLEVRARIWVAALRLGLDFAPWGVGAGNFAIVFPTERDPTEIELSTHGRLDNAESAVDHAHNDFVQLAVEAGVPAVVALGALAVFLVRWRRQGVYTASPEAVAAASGLTSILVAALAHAPLYDTAASAILTALLLGILGSLDSSPGWSGAPSAPAVLARPLGVVVLCALPLPMLVAYRALRADILLTQERVHPSVSLDTLREAALLAPDDVHAVLLLARRLRAEGDRNGALAAFQEAKRRQLFLVEAILNIGVLLAERGDFKGALDAFQVCEDLDPGHPALRVNRRQLLLHRAEAERDARRDREAAALLDQAVNLGLPDVLLREWGNAFFELKEYARAIPYLDRYAMRQPLDGENWHKTGLAFQKLGSLESASLDFAKAHHLFALEHVRAGNLDAAARSAKQYQRWAGPKEAGPLVLEALLALRRGNAGEARAALDGARDRGLTLDAITWELADYAPLRDDPDLGPRVRKLVK
jgi:tetratricopeptide (TPR) repeat protein